MNLNVVICRESALQNADDEGQASAKQVRRKRPAVTDEATEEERPVRHRKTVKNMAEERIKTKRTRTWQRSESKLNGRCLWGTCLPAAPRRRKVHPKKTSINAYIVFKEEEAAAGALRRNGQEIQLGFHIRVDRVSRHTGLDHKRSVFVGNLPYDVMEPPVREHFEDCGNVEAVRLVRDRDSGMYIKSY
ncbi:RNA-binding protein 34-like [Sinocyclocheilus rhinocerous]|uniref:RNA-binding protein 34-like n=1 Tax=Sinocyclocheilus rhinocerous TaxID=307959 RepID=UPI0007B87195|nr:PREDICTED: RNA-binding protein 34-like [Sinocyclocheilus rhinocerous]